MQKAENEISPHFKDDGFVKDCISLLKKLSKSSRSKMPALIEDAVPF